MSSTFSGFPIVIVFTVTLGLSGNRYFATNTDRVLYEDGEKTFETDMPEKGAPTHGVEMK